MDENMMICGACEKELPAADGCWTKDCHGIWMRKVCPDCWDRIMGEVGFDGVLYTAADENIEPDW